MTLAKTLLANSKSCRLEHAYAQQAPGGLSENAAIKATESIAKKIRALQYQLYAENKQSLVIVLQGLDAAGKDGTIKHVLGMMNPQGCTVTSFKEPTALELRHDFLWRIHPHAPACGEVAIFNRSHYEDVLITRVHQLCPKSQINRRYQQIKQFESLLATQNNTRIIKFFLHISPEEQLTRFAARLNDPAKNWKISTSDYTERQYWADFRDAYALALEKTSTNVAPWYIIPADNKWYPNYAVASIVLETLEAMAPKLPKPSVDLDQIREAFHHALQQEQQLARKKAKKK
ncbi:MAG: hypothetical protein RL651_1023 [Pseudomonadota bacterium]